MHANVKKYLLILDSDFYFIAFNVLDIFTSFAEGRKCRKDVLDMFMKRG